jgi:hypothetical protein
VTWIQGVSFTTLPNTDNLQDDDKGVNETMIKDSEKPLSAESSQQEIVVQKERAVFWLDGNGHWHNEGGRIELKKVIHRFNAAIQKDADGYFLTQMNCDRLEKVYFPYEDTALFAIDMTKKAPLTLRLNTGQRLPLYPEKLFVAGESVYTLFNEDWIKFSERSLLKISTMINYEKSPHIFVYQGKEYPIHKKNRPAEN